LFSSTKGLCGGYNKKLFKFLNIQEGNKKDFILIGGKGIKYVINNFKQNNILFSEENDLSINKNIHFVYSLNAKVASCIQQQKYKKINIIYSEVINGVVNVKIIDLVQLLTNNEIKKETNLVNGKVLKFDSLNNILFEQSFISLFTFSALFKAIVNSANAENYSRMQAMSEAKNNCQDLYTELSLEYNKVRQENITTEIIELAGGLNE
jgi:F-type H+-transporting ATPase subunit gamma